MSRRDDAIAIPLSAIRRFVLLVMIVALVGFVAFAAWSRRDDIFGHSATARSIDPNAFQAVFLVTSQVYFGHLRIDGDTYLLSDTYYLSTADGANSGSGQLVKRGSELHGPRDPMIIPARAVLFVENMRDDSQVLGAIRALKSGQTVPAQTPASTVRPSASATPTR